MDQDKLKSAKFETKALHGGYTPEPTTHSMAVPIYQTTSYVFDSTQHAADLFALAAPGNIYSRIMNPTVDVLEKRLAMLEGGVAGLATASGQAAEMLGLLTIASTGDEIISSTDLYGGTWNLFANTFKKMGIDVVFVDPGDLDGIRNAITPKTKAIYAETIGNPKLIPIDFEAVASIAHEAGVPFMVDNTLTSPYLCNPLAWGADIVVHSTTKYIGGHGTSIGGAIIDGGTFDWTSGRFPAFTEPDPSYHDMVFSSSFGNLAYIIKARVQMLRDLGPAMSPFNAFLFLQGLETLAIRMERHSENALKVAQWLEQRDEVSWVNYPTLPSFKGHDLAMKYMPKGGSGILGFGIKGGKDSAVRFIEALQLFSHLANVGDARSLAIHPATTTHAQLSEEDQIKTGVTPDFIRLSIGLEHIDDILADLKQALGAACCFG